MEAFIQSTGEAAWAVVFAFPFTCSLVLWILMGTILVIDKGMRGDGQLPSKGGR